MKTIPPKPSRPQTVEYTKAGSFGDASLLIMVVIIYFFISAICGK